MKTNRAFHFLIIAAAAALTLLSTCTKTPSEQVFAGTARIRGVILYQNVVSNRPDTAATAQLTLEKGGDKTTDFSLVLTNGTFDISPLNPGDYTFEVTFYHTIPGSTKSVLYHIKTPSFYLANGEFKDRDTITLLPSVTASPTLQIKVTDSSGSVVPNAPVYLYTDPGTLVANRRTGSGSLKSAITNTYGYVLFDNLQANLNYFGASYVVRGGDTISNMTTDNKPLLSSPLSATILNTASITVLRDIYYNLEVIVIDQNGALIPNATVSIYSDKTLLAKNRFTGAGSLGTQITNQTGATNFKGLQKLQYYISAFKPAGKDTLSNILNDQNARPVLKPNNPNQNAITIK